MAYDTTKKQSPPEFLLKLYKILTQEDEDIIEWEKGNIRVKDPHRLAKTILAKHFRHAKFSSFQRQLNYFGFHKTEGKGKLAPCVYTNDSLVGGSLNELLSIKRKTSTQNSKPTSTGPSRFSIRASDSWSPIEDFITRVVHTDDLSSSVKREREFDSIVMPALNSFGEIDSPSLRTLKKTRSEGSLGPMVTHHAGQMTLINHDMVSTGMPLFQGSAYPRPCSQSCPAQPAWNYPTIKASNELFLDGFTHLQPQSNRSMSWDEAYTATSVESSYQDPFKYSIDRSPVPPLMDPLYLDGASVDFCQEDDITFVELCADLLDDAYF